MLDKALESILTQGGAFAALAVLSVLAVIVLYKANNDMRAKMELMRDAYEEKMNALYDLVIKETRNGTVALERNTVAMSESAKSMDGRSVVIDRAVATIDKVATSIDKMAMTNETVREHFKGRVDNIDSKLAALAEMLKGRK
jgi:hypothetical protein